MMMLPIYNGALNWTTAQPIQSGIAPDVAATLATIRATVQSNGDEALIRYATQFDRVQTDAFCLTVTDEERESAIHHVPQSFLDALEMAHRNITDYHSWQRPNGWDRSPRVGVRYGIRYTPLDAVGLYVPGGRAIYPSSVLMNAIPARLAGVQTIAIATPPQPDGTIPPQILVAANRCGIRTIIKSGGAQAIYALAFGTHAVPKVDKIVGPGNKYVDGAKRDVYGLVDIDKPAGPSEVLVYITNPKYAPFAAAELMAQMEHDPDARGVAITESADCAAAIDAAFQALLSRCNRRDIITQTIPQSGIIVVDNRADAVHLINTIASEHLVILVDDSQSVMTDVRHAGSIFLGPYTPVALGDYIAGPNHVLPTNAAARYSSPLGVMDFMKYSGYCEYDKAALASVQPHMAALTQMEGFDAHQLSVDIRLD